jgi:hypothetical protein
MKTMSDALARCPKGPKAHLALVEKWKTVPEGTPVIVTKDDGAELRTKTRSIPWMLGADSRDPSDPTHSPGHTAVIMVEGITGGYGLWRVRLDSANVH